jgi:dipeptidase E
MLLLSNSRNPGGEYLGHALEWLDHFLGPGRARVAFVPFASVSLDYAAYRDRVAEVLAPIGVGLQSVAESDDPAGTIRNADAVLVGGGNSFQLLKRAAELGLLAAIGERVLAGMPYLGWSAGANLACPSIRTTNDMPIVEPPSFSALGLVPFQINPHYTDRVLPDHGGESRDDRIAEFLVLNPGIRVVGLREGSALRREGRGLTLLGDHPLRLFEPGAAPREVPPGDLSLLLLP